MNAQDTEPPFAGADIERFMREGYLKLEHAFSKDTAARARAILWRDTGYDPANPASWAEPVVRLNLYADEPFVTAANTPRLNAALDQIAGRGRWLPRKALGTFPIRFPSPKVPNDTGWHIDVSFGGDPSDFLSWRANIVSKGRALLMLFLFSDVGVDDAPTRIRVGSHFDIARKLAPAGEAGLSLGELAAEDFRETAHCPEVLATGEAGTAYLCHPFLVHGAQPHRGMRPRFMAQPPLLPVEDLCLARADGNYSPVEDAIRRAIAG